VTDHPWYAFMDRPRSPDGKRLRFGTIRCALRWMAITSVVAAFWLGLLLYLVTLGKSRIAVTIFVILMAPAVGPIVLASLIAFAKTTRDLPSIYQDRRHRIRQI
jgi:purine-cytosine permease-like protein